MKSLIPWVCLIATSATHYVCADDLMDYRLGNYNKAIEPLMSQSGKNPIADYYLGRIYLYGYGELKNNQLAIRYFNQSAEKGYLPAIQFMARYTLLHDKDPKQALNWFQKAAEAGDVDAQMFVAAAYMHGIGVKRNSDTATRYYISAAKNGNSVAQFTLAQNFIESRNTSNGKLGLIWLNKSVASGNLNALTQLGTLYITGNLVDKDEKKGEELLNQAAAQGFAPAMIALGKLALEKNQKDEALKWFENAGQQNNDQTYLALAQVYLQEKSSIYNPKTAFMWTLKAAQDGSPQAKRELAQMYEKGIGVESDPVLAKQWLNQAIQDGNSKNQEAALTQAALWLSNGSTNKLEQTNLQMKGILSAWNNTSVLEDSAYNQAPKLETFNRKVIYQPHFELVQPNDVPIASYYDALLRQNSGLQVNQWTYPLYPLNKQIASLERINSPMIVQANLPVPYMDANYTTYYDDYSQTNFINLWIPGWQSQLNFTFVFKNLYFKAILGDAQSQFEVGQMFQYGLGVVQNEDSAIAFYQNAAQQQHLGAEYNLAILYLKRAKDKSDYQLALNDLTDAAFKGNKKSQYVLSRILEKGITGSDGTVYIQANPEQATSMLYLAAANNYGVAEYELADSLARQNEDALSVAMQKNKIAMIRQLYQGAVDRGVSEAVLPLAFYDAMGHDKKKQDQAFQVAQKQAAAGNDKATLLLGLLYDRGIGVQPNLGQAISWYQQSGKNAVSDFILGTYTAQGKGINKNGPEGMAQLQKAVDNQFAYADFNMAVLQKQNGEQFLPNLINAYQLGDSHAGIVLADYYLAGGNSDPEKIEQAKQIYLGLAEKGDSNAQLKLGYMLAKGVGSMPDHAGAQRWYTASAEQGNPLAQYLLGQFYQLGENGELDYNLAKQWYQKAANMLPAAFVALGFIAETVDDNYPQALKEYQQAAAKGDYLGAYNLALMYLYGKGTPVDYQKVKELFTKSSDKVHEAMDQLGTIYFNGLGGVRDLRQALSWYEKAAALGNSNALYHLGLLAETGVMSKLVLNDALKYYQLAANKGNEKAMLALARMYHYGLGVEKNPQIAASLYQKLVLRQNAYAQYQLGTYYLNGTAGERSLVKGKQLLQQASDNGSIQARKMLQRLDAQTQEKVSFIEPIVINKMPNLAGQSAELMYLDALNEWNQGDELLSCIILQRLVIQYPNFVPAKRIFDQLNQARLVSEIAINSEPIRTGSTSSNQH